MDLIELVFLSLIIVIIIGCLILLIKKQRMTFIQYIPYYVFADNTDISDNKQLDISKDEKILLPIDKNQNDKTLLNKIIDYVNPIREQTQKNISRNDIDSLPWDNEVTHCHVMHDIDDTNMYSNVKNVNTITFY